MSAPSIADVAAFRALLDEEASALRAFLALLNREQQALVDGDIDRIQSLANEKSAATAQLTHIGTRRDKFLARGGISHTRSDIESWLASQPRAAETRASWQGTIALAAEAQQTNRRNGHLIACRMQHNRQALAVLLAAGQPCSLYGPDGQTRAASSARHLGTV